MSDLRGASQPCRCIVHKKRSGNGSTIAEEEDFMGLTSLLQELNVLMCDAICPLCSGSINLKRTTFQQHKRSMNGEYPFIYGERSLPSEELSKIKIKSKSNSSEYNTIIVNQIPVKINGEKIDCDKFFSLFSQYGKIKRTYLCKDVYYRCKSEKVARITFENKEDARKVWEDSKNKMIKYEDHVLMITLTSDDDCPIENLSDDCLRLIFKYITDVRDKFNVESVCKRLRFLSRESWSSITEVSRYCKSRTWRTIISRAAESIRAVEIHIPCEEDSYRENSFEDSVKKSSISSEEGSHGEASFEDPYIDASFENFMENEEYLGRGTPWTKDAIKSLSLISQNLFKLEKLSISVSCIDRSAVNDQLDAIIANNRSLKCLRLSWVELAGDNFIDSLPAGMEEIQIHAEDLRELNYDFDLSRSTPVNVSRFGNLQVLAFSNFEISEDQLEGIESLGNLTALNFTMSDVHPSNIEKIVHFTKLEFLAIPNCQISGVSLSKILENNKGLKHLDISDIKEITNSSFQHVPQLQHLQVLLMKNVTKVTDKFFTSMPKLEELNCNGCTSITNAGIRRLFTPDSMLEKLFVADCSITLAILKTAYAWRPHGAQVLNIYINKGMIKKWKDSGLEKELSTSSEPKHISVSEYVRSHSGDSIHESWLENFYRLN